jgi:hypothetical protein
LRYDVTAIDVTTNPAWKILKAIGEKQNATGPTPIRKLAKKIACGAIGTACSFEIKPTHMVTILEFGT